MPRRDADLLIADMLGAIRKIEQYTEGMDQEQFLQDEKTIDAVARNLEIVGEATRQLPEDFIARFPNVPWRQMAGLRNRIVHDYFGLDLEIIWQILHFDLRFLCFGWLCGFRFHGSVSFCCCLTDLAWTAPNTVWRPAFRNQRSNRRLRR